MAGAAHQIDDDRAQNLVRVRPSDVIERLKHLIAEVEGVAVAGEVKVGRRGKDEIGKAFLAVVAVVEGEQDALGGAVVALVDEGAEPALQGVEVLVVSSAGEREALAPRGSGGAVGDLGQAMD